MKKTKLFAILPAFMVLLTGCKIEDAFNIAGENVQKWWDYGVAIAETGAHVITGVHEHVHVYNYHPELLPTKEASGHKAYYICEICKEYFDEHKNPTTWDELVLPKIEE